MPYIVENATIEAATEKAVLVKADNWEKAQWIPRSQIEGGEDLEREEEYDELEVTDWFAQKQDWT